MPKEEDKKKKMVVVEEIAEPVEENELEKPESEPETVKVEDQEPSSEEIVVEETEKTNYLWIIVPTALLVGAFVGGLITYFSGLSRLSSVEALPSPVVVATPEVEEEVKTEEEDEFDRSVVKLQVLNGSGIAGFAGKAKTMLEGLGYENVAVGNASSSNFEETVISVKSDKKELLESLIKDLSEDYEVSTETETLPASSPYDFVITLGNK
ncbi:MAG: LytR C-terminal domain-containing protein [bacterium]|nr:MAG: LytR C-terminal domain-containing protein [bacterium]